MNLYFRNMLIFKVYLIFRCCMRVKAVLLATSEQLRWPAGKAGQQMGWCTEIKPQTDAFPNYSCGTSHLQLPHPDFQGCWSSCLHFGKLPASTDKLMKQFLVQLFCFNSLLSADLAPWPDLTRLTNPGLCLITLIGLSYSVKSELGLKSWSSAPPPWLILLLPGVGSENDPSMSVGSAMALLLSSHTNNSQHICFGRARQHGGKGGENKFKNP